MLNTELRDTDEDIRDFLAAFSPHTLRTHGAQGQSLRDRMRCLAHGLYVIYLEWCDNEIACRGEAELGEYH